MFSISGPAGTGKTFLMCHTMNNVREDYERMSELLGLKPINFEPVLTATTNKAAEVLQQATGFPTSTIHSALKLKVYDDYNTGVSKINKTREWIKLSNKLFFIDEASMVDETLYGFIDETLDDTCKVIFLGDHCQLAPVKEELSKVYAESKPTAQLSIPVRNAGQPALVQLCEQLRQTVETGVFKPIEPVPGVIDYVDGADAQSYIDQEFKTEETDARILCYTNNRVHEYVDYIRQLRGYPVHLTNPEYVILNSTYIAGKTMLQTESEFQIQEVQDPKPTVFQDEQFALMTRNVVLKTPGTTIKYNVLIAENKEELQKLKRLAAHQKNWVVYYSLKNKIADLRPRDASTIYKAQGSTFKTAFLDIGNIGTCMSPSQTARMLYVGASRAKERVLLFGTLPGKYNNSHP